MDNKIKSNLSNNINQSEKSLKITNYNLTSAKSSKIDSNNPLNLNEDISTIDKNNEITEINNEY